VPALSCEVYCANLVVHGSKITLVAYLSTA
jgi:hypothetical protein